MNSKYLFFSIIFVLLTHFTGCSLHTFTSDKCPPGTQNVANCPPLGAIDDPEIAVLYDRRALDGAIYKGVDPIQYSSQTKTPLSDAQAKFIGSTEKGGLISLAAKLFMIENAEHTVDVAYYIFRDDAVGLAILGSLCDAVERGVDVRIMVDSLGSISLNKKYLRALKSCEVNSGFMRNSKGETTIYKARVQPVIFNAISKIFVNHNRRSHDKLLVTDGRFDDKDFVMTGGRNISLDYYGIKADGSSNPDTYLDAEILLHGGDAEGESEDGVGDVTETYYDLLFLFKNNKLLKVSPFVEPFFFYTEERALMRSHLKKIKQLPLVQKHLQGMESFFSEDFHDAEVRLTHELTNLTNKNVVYNTVENARLNPNSIMSSLNSNEDDEYDTMQIVSPYLFAALYRDSEGNVILDEAEETLTWLDDHPDRTLTIITNSVLTTDNFFTQALIDMDLAPRLLMNYEWRKRWQNLPSSDETNPEITGRSTWAEMINHPRLKIYETGTLDDVLLGGEKIHGKQHGKYIVTDDTGFVGTTNFDYRSRLYNNEMGFVFKSKSLAVEMRKNSSFLIDSSYIWGSEDWLIMRQKVIESGGLKGMTTKSQRQQYKLLKKSGLKWYF